MVAIATVKTTPFKDQKPGTSGLRKRVKVFQQPHYLENFVASIFRVIPDHHPSKTILVGGDGRFYSKAAISTIIRLALGCQNKIARIIVAKDGILSTPAASHLIRKRGLVGGILLTASHNPGGPDADFGVKWNGENGGPAPANVTDKIFQHTLEISSYNIAPEATASSIDITKIGETVLQSGLVVEIIDGVSDYVELMKTLFDLRAIKEFFSATNFRIIFDGMNGVTGPYGRAIFVNELGLDASSVIRSTPLEDFGGVHPDPNLTYGKETVDKVFGGAADFGACSDGDGDRNMILGSEKTFVTPSDSVAIIAAHSSCIPYFRSGLKGLARSMPTSSALDLVAKKLKVRCYEVPTGWKYFGNLMDSGMLSICGEESFGTGGDYIREKDGIFAVLAWCQILASTRKSVRQILGEFYSTFGRCLFQRFDFEEVSSEAGSKVMEKLRSYASSQELVGKSLGDEGKLAVMDDFEYLDPVDASVASKQGIRMIYETGSRIVVRLSGTGSSGATIRVYLEKYLTARDGLVDVDPASELKDLANVALECSGITEFTGRTEPTVIT